MEQVYRPSHGDTVSIGEFLQKYQQSLSSVKEMHAAEEGLAKWMGFTGDLDPVQAAVDVNLMDHDEDIKVMPVDMTKTQKVKREHNQLSVPKEALSLACVQNRIDRYEGNLPASAIQLKSKHQTAHFLQPNAATAEAAPGALLDMYSEVLITVRCFCPSKYTPYTIRPQKLDREVVLLGRQHLTDLRDQIRCMCDEVGPLGDVSDEPKRVIRDPYKGKGSGFLFIGNTFYNDTRQAESLDYSAMVCQWAQKQPEIQPLHRGKMEATRFIDLPPIRLGYPYLYTHYGECEHLFIFSDLRVIDSLDAQMQSQYPYLRRLPIKMNQSCDLCGIFLGTYLVTNSNQHIFDSVYLCEKCLVSYHYEDDRKIGSFKAYRINSS